MRKTSKWWYGRYNVGGKVHCVNLRVAIEGERPESITQEGNRAFERSRGKAQTTFDALVKTTKEKHQAEEYVQQLHEIRTGRRIDSIPLGMLVKEWEQAPRKRSGSPRYVAQAHTLFDRFVAFVEKTYPKTETLADVTPDVAEAFMLAERGRRVTGRTWNAALILLRSAFKVLARKANVVRNPFAGILTADEDTAHRRPFNQAELKAIMDAAAKDEFIRPIIVTGLCTAMRRGDCCLLQWRDVDLKERFVRVKTAKTGETVEIPMFPLFREEVEGHVGNQSEHVFPEQAAMYLKNAQGVSYRVKQLLAAAGFYDVKEEKDEEKDKKPRPKPDERPRLPAAELLPRGLAALAKAPDGEIKPGMRQRMEQAFCLYVGGDGIPTVARKMGVSKGLISRYLHEIDKRAGVRVMREIGRKLPTVRLGDASVKRGLGLRRASVRDFHSFRSTWITLALAAGVPMELVTRVTGHQTVDVVLKHYFRPGREDFRKAIEGAMPALLMGSARGQKSEGEGQGVVRDVQVVYEEAPTPAAMIRAGLEALEGMTGKNWNEKREEALRAFREAAEWVEGRILHEERAAKRCGCTSGAGAS
jgi:integrase